jgi:hypothetical protein
MSVSAASQLLRELVYGAALDEAWILNRGDPGLLRSLDRLDAKQASAPGTTGASVAAHIAHLAYGFELLERWARGEEPFEGADYSAAWRQDAVSEAEWADLRSRLARAIGAWQDRIASPGGADQRHVQSSVAHLAYHLGAIRQIAPAARGPEDR